ncbi:hypothetical protein SAMN02800694_0182 [Luteibacter sp. UNCMF331Sha3.1]|uniref:hypothetical protein n=1 Tax=Luteibacter sp. UNCMF331Sha3.1 TaxID=1502760 RepID=UPI0008D777FA|nr:hypothetical protein [Luteibacter sp. UNCMF331Sha3.1]SEM20848.1 hypothetical protein SAMN02800694_0182 [Luteibacter sp. UNCMF331Sha3.1]
MKISARAIGFGASLLLAGTAFAQSAPSSPNQVPPPPPGEATPKLPDPTSGALAPPPPPATPDAQNANVPPPAADAPPPPPPPPPGMEAGSAGAAMATPQGQVNVNSGPAPAKSYGPPPSFESLAKGKKYITPEDASAYPLLANDWDYAAHQGKRISKAQYDRWVQQAGAGK